MFRGYCFCFVFFFFNDTATTEIYTLSLHDALPISGSVRGCRTSSRKRSAWSTSARSEEHTSELQSRPHLVCRLLLEKKKKITNHHILKKKKNNKIKKQLNKNEQ